jgi:hypothetical protein
MTPDPGLEEITAEVVVPAGQPGVYTLALSGVSAPGNITVEVRKDGYAFSPASQTVPGYYVSPVFRVAFDNVTANGAANETTTRLSLAFTGALPLGRAT